MWGWLRCWVTDAVCSTELMRRLPLKSSRCLTGSAGPSPDESATAPVPHQRANSDSRSNRWGSPTSHIRVAAEMVLMPGSSRRVVPWRLRSSSMSRSRRRISRRAVRSWSMNSQSQLRRCRPAGVVAVSGSMCSRVAQPGFGLALGVELVAYLGGELGDLVADMVQHPQRSPLARPQNKSQQHSPRPPCGNGHQPPASRSPGRLVWAALRRVDRCSSWGHACSLVERVPTQRIWGTPQREYGEPAGTPANPQVKAGHKTPTLGVCAEG